MQRYDELRIRIRSTAPGRYLVLASGAAAAAHVLECAPDVPGTLRADLDRLIGIELGRVPKGRTSIERAVSALGRRLYALLFPPPMEACLADCLEHARRRGNRLRLRFDLPAELQELPLEVLTSPKNVDYGRMALNPHLSLVRNLGTGHATVRAPRPKDRPEKVHVVIAACAAEGLPPLDAAAEAARLQQLPELAAETCAVPAVHEELVRALKQGGKRPSALVLAAHGAFDADEHVGAVDLQTAQGEPHRMRAHILAASLAQSEQLRLAVLNLCSGAVASVAEPHAGLAQELVALGVPAVTAMRGPISDRAAAKFSPELMTGLLENQTVDEAMHRARIAVASQPGHTSIEWCTPVLFLHDSLHHGWLFKARRPVQGEETGSLHDPLHAGATALEDYARDGDVHMKTIVRALHHLRDQGEWQRAARIARDHTDPDCTALHAEACRELDWPPIEEACRELAEDRDADSAEHGLTSLSEHTPRELHQHLVREARGTRRRVARQRAETHRAECEWDAAAEAYTQVQELAEPPESDPHAAAACVYCRARESEEAGDWQAAHTRYLQAGDFEDAPERADLAAYQVGRLAEDAAEWRQAADAYGACPGHGDAGQRGIYCRARAAEQEGRWSQAEELYGQLPGHHRDVGRRGSYARGRAADAAGDWQGVLDGFGGLPDQAEGGEVGTRRFHARARLAEARGDWNEVLTFVSELPGSARGGALEMLRSKARGGLAEQRGDWASAVAHYDAALAHDEGAEGQDVAHRRAYAQAHVHETAGEWGAAAHSYAQLPGGHRDAADRASYATARAAEARAVQRDAEESAHWTAAAEGYAQLPPGFADAGPRARYARARLAEARGAWQEAVAEAAQLAAYREAPVIVAYARARQAEACDQWEAAAAQYGDCPDWRDAPARRDHARARVLQTAGQWSAALALYAKAGDSMPEAREQAQRIRTLLRAVPWADGLAAQTLLADPCALRQEAFPYNALQEVGITSAASIDEVQDATFVLMEHGGMTGAQRDAWKRLRHPATRLEIDAFLYEVRRPEKLRARLAELDAEQAEGLLERLCDDLPEDAALLRMMAHGRDEALAQWDAELAAAPGDADTLHAAAVARWWQAVEYEDGGAWEHAIAAWRTGLPLWAALLSSDAHWNRWSQARTGCYRRPVTAQEVVQLRWVLSRRITEQLAKYAEQHASAGREGQAQEYRGLVTTFEVELDGAREVGEIGGIRLPDGSPDALAAGPQYVRGAGLSLHLARTMAGLSEGSTSAGPGGPALQRVRWAFSTLAEAFTYCAHQRFQAALEVLPREIPDPRALQEDCPAGERETEGHTQTCPHCAHFLLHDPVYALLPQRRARLLRDTAELAVDTRLACARQALPTDRPGAVAEALEHWRQALRAADVASMGVRTKTKILKTVLGRANSLAEAPGSGVGAKLDQAVELLEGATELLRPLAAQDRERLVAKHAKVLATRGVWQGFTRTQYGYPRDLVAAERDLRRALDLNPEAVYPRDNLVRCLVFGRSTQVLPGEALDRMRDLREAYHLLHEGLRHHPGNGHFTDTLLELVGDVETLVLADLSVAELNARMEEVEGELAPPKEERTGLAGSLAGRSAAALQRGDLTTALDTAARATRYSPQDPVARAALEHSLDAWLKRHDSPDDSF